MKVVYVAGPFRCASQHVPGQQDSWGIQSNVMSAMALGLEVWRAGAAAVIPHANTMFFQNAAPDNVWLDGDLAMLAKCDAVIMTADWRRSTGARAEHDYARHLGIPVFYWLTDLRSWLELGVTGAEPQPVADAVDPVAQAHPNGLRA
jgi:nucleoside 2-deoxyribosyltransferase